MFCFQMFFRIQIAALLGGAHRARQLHALQGGARIARVRGGRDYRQGSAEDEVAGQR
jgi:hypothetical protein